MFGQFHRRSIRTVDIYFSDQHFFIDYCISCEYSDPSCTLKWNFPSSAFQILVPLSGNNWSLRWSYFRASLRHPSDVHGPREMECMSLHTARCFHSRLYALFHDFACSDCNKCRQTSRPVGRAEIQTSCNFEANILDCSDLLDCFLCRCNIVSWKSPNNHRVWSYSHFALSSNLHCLVLKNFPLLAASSNSSTRQYLTTTTEPSDPTEHCAIQKGGVQCTVGAVGISCVLFTIWNSEF